MDIDEILREGHDLWHQGLPASALELYQMALKKLAPNVRVGDRVAIQGAYALCLCEVGKLEQALEQYRNLHQLCIENDFDQTTVLRQWAKALEQSGDFVGARRTYGLVIPNPETAPIDSLKWNHALGLLNWRDGRLAEARDNLAAATELMPAEQSEASALLAVLGNDALLSLELGNVPRAMRLADQMIATRQVVGETTLSNEVNLIRVRAALEKKRGNDAEVVAILQSGVKLLEKRVPDDWMRRLDLTNDFVTASLNNGSTTEAISYLMSLCDAAPESMVWIGRFMLARLQIGANEIETAKDNLSFVIASIVGSGSPESELEIIFDLSKLAASTEMRPSTVFLGKLALKYLTQIAHTFEAAELNTILEAGDQVAQQTVENLQALGRFEEAVSIAELSKRINRFALILRRPPPQSAAQSPVSFDPQELLAEANWLEDRRLLGELRAAGDQESVMRFAAESVTKLIAFQNPNGRALRPSDHSRPKAGRLRLRFVPAGHECVVHYIWSDKTQSQKINVSAEVFFRHIARLRSAIAGRTAWRKPAEVLYEYLIYPIRDELSTIDCLEVDATGVLARIPFGLLSDGDTCVIQKVPVVYVLAVDPPIDERSPRIGLIHFSAFQSGPLARSPAFLETLKPAIEPARFFSGGAFTRDGFRECLSERPSYISIAAHLDSEPTRPDIWALGLGDGEPLYLSDLGGDAFDLNNVSVVLLTTCSSGLDDTSSGGQSLAALALEKGVRHIVGTLWDISETAAARFVNEFWTEFLLDAQQDPSKVLASIQSRHAKALRQPNFGRTASGGIGDRSDDLTPEDWAAFAIFENGNVAQRLAIVPDRTTDMEAQSRQGLET